VDRGYVDADVVVSSQLQQGIEIVGPVAADTSTARLKYVPR
jgi:hypothetical protein